jgi:uridylate kinase
MNISIRRKVAALTVAALTVVGGRAAIAAAQTGSRSEESQAIIADAAEELGIKATELNAALKQALIDSLDAKVAAGELLQAQANTLKAKIQFGPSVKLAEPLGSGELASDAPAPEANPL